jgi:hypothetical protein
MRKALISIAAAAALVLPAGPALAQNDCIYSGAEYVVHDTVDCIHYILDSGWGRAA